MESEPSDVLPEPSSGFKISSIIWAIVLVGIAVAVTTQAVLIMGTKANTKFGTVSPSIGSTVTGSR